MDKELTIDKVMAKSRRKRVATFDLNKMEIVGVSLVACPANGETLERAEEIKNATRFKKLENKNNTNNIDDLFV